MVDAQSPVGPVTKWWGNTLDVATIFPKREPFDWVVGVQRDGKTDHTFPGRFS